MAEDVRLEKRDLGFPGRIRKARLDVAALGIMAVAFLLNFLRIGRVGFGDKYYAAAVKSMLANWHNFFFASFDPAGFVTVDKPAAGLWLQTLSAAIFGFKGWAIILPQALAGALSVGILFVLVKKAYGRTAGLVAGLVLAVTPITVATSRTNQLDVLLVIVLLAAAWSIINAPFHLEGMWKIDKLDPLIVALLSKSLDPTLLDVAQNALDLATTIAEGWLTKYMGLSPTDAKRIAEDLGDASRFHSHSRSIRYPEVKQLGLSVIQHFDGKARLSILSNLLRENLYELKVLVLARFNPLDRKVNISCHFG
jgi:hypothetical protein